MPKHLLIPPEQELFFALLAFLLVGIALIVSAATYSSVWWIGCAFVTAAFLPRIRWIGFMAACLICVIIIGALSWNDDERMI